MANPYDVGARLAEGRSAVDDVEQYVAACRRLGYEHRDLTMHPMQVRDWYGGEEGLDLRAVDADRAALSAAASAAEEATRRQTDLGSELAAAWSGEGAASAHEFIWRSCQAATAVSAALRAAAEAMGTLRNGLWRAVDAKVVATETVDARQRSQRAEWLAAAKTVTTGAGDLATASELIELQVKPFVDLDVGSDWLAAMRGAIAAVNAAYDAAIADTTTAPTAVFGVPGDLGPRPPSRSAEAADRGAVTAAPVQTVPASAVGSVGPVASSVPSMPAAPWSGQAPAAPSAVPDGAPLPSAVPASPMAPSAPSTPSMPSMPSMGDLGAGTSTLGSGLSGFGQQLADLIGGLVGSADDGLPDNPDNPDNPDTPDTADAEEPAGPDPEDDPETAQDPDAVDDPESDGPVEEQTTEPPPAEEPTPTSVAAPPPVEPPPVPQGLPEPVADAAEPTPCEIAADELPQVGE